MTFLAAAALSAILCAALIFLLKPLLQRYALARPNARSSHTVPTPQGGGIAVVGAALVIAALLGGFPSTFRSAAAAAVVLAVLGAIDDIRPLPAAPRLLVQVLAVAAVVWASGPVFGSPVPLWAERILLVLAGVWFVNLVNFMDGLDWLTVAGMVPALGALAILGFTGTIPPAAGLTAAALFGAFLGFAPFNKPVARLFLGDVGSLPIGLLVGWLLLELAAAGALAAALLLPLYHLMDATITLLRRLARGELVWEAHRSHFYQQATRNGFSVLSVSAHIFGLNLWLLALAAATLAWPSPPVQAGGLLVGMASVGVMLWRFATPKGASGWLHR